MTIVYEPNKLLKKIAPEKKIQRLIKKDLSVNKAVLSMFSDIDFISKRDIFDVALKTSKQYKARYRSEKKSGQSNSAALSQTLNEKKMIINRVQNSVVYQIAEEIKAEYAGEYYIWLPSDADTPDPEHQLNYGKKFKVGEGEQPGDRYGCKCGMEILVKEDTLNL